MHKYSSRIASLPEKVTIFQTFPMRGWILLIFMMGLGITLRYIPDIPSAFTAAFYSGLVYGLVFLVKNDLQEGFLASLNVLTRC